MAHIYISAAHKSSGKTIISIGLCRELRARGKAVQPFKKGPDYIDPLWLSRASGRDCFNLDFHTMGRGEIERGFAYAIADADIGLIEGNVGLFDSVDVEGRNSNAELAKALGAPLVLVLDAQGMSRGIAPLLLGYQAFDPELNIAGVIANKVGGSRHESNLRRVLEYYTDIPLVGAIHRAGEMRISERHLGLIPSNEAEEADAQIERIRGLVADQVDLAKLLEIAGAAAKPTAPPCSEAAQDIRERVRIGIARDDAFGFYYPDDLASLQRAGAELISFSPVRDRELPGVDGLLIGGGFPEFRLRELSENRSMRASIHDYIESGGVAYAECGGLMYLCRGLSWEGRQGEMCGVLDADVVMHERPQGRGYVRLRETLDFPWPRAGREPREVRAHEFHHSAIRNPERSWRYGYEILRGTGVDGRHDGILHKNLVASYSHLRSVGGNDWTRRFVEQVRACRQ